MEIKLNKAGLRKVLRELGLVRPSYSGRDRDYKIMEYWGIKGSSIGPMTCTNVYREINDAKQAEVIRKLNEVGFATSINSVGFLEISANGKLVGTMFWKTFRAYASHLDAGYQNFYFCLQAD